MLQADEPGCAPAGLRFDEDLHLVDGEPDVDGDYVEEDHLSISVENLLAFLDEQPEGSAAPKAAAVSPLRISSNGPPESILIPNDVDIENDAWHQDVSPESTAVAAPEPEGYESSQWAPLNYMEMSYDREVATGPGYLFKSPETSGNYIDAYNQDSYDVDLYNSTSNGNNFFNGKSLGLSTDWLRLSLSDNDTHDSAGVTGYPLSITERDQKPFSENVECGTLPHETTAEDCNDFTEYTTYTNNILMERGGEESGKTSAEPSIQVKFEPTLNADSPSSDVPEDELKGSYLLDDYHFLAHGKFSSDEAYESRILDGNAYMAPLTELRIAPDSACTNMPLASKMKSVATGITMEASKNYFISRDSGGEGCNGLFEESICLQPSLSDDMEITAIPNDERNGQLCAFQSFPTKTEAIRGRQEEDLSVSYPDIPIIDLDACSPDENCHKGMGVKYASSLESSSIFRNGMMTPIKKKSDFKNVIQSNPFQKDRSEGFVPPTYHQCHHSVDEVIQRNTLQGKIMAKDYNTHMMDNIQIFPTRNEEVSVWPKARDEQLTFQMALQDLSQPKTEASPPDGVLAVPLLRHQRIALSWMVQKETSNLNCSGGILADDQGLGKTVSTIALILSERSPLSKSGEAIKQVEIETLSLDDDEVVHLNGNSDKKRMKSMISDSSITPSVKGRPAAGTLVVCPTSVLRQWADELQSKVTSKGNLSFLVYHGSNRTKDPNELTKYDVVLTTYSIVSMEVPKQLSSDKDDEEKVKSDGPDSTGSSTNRKRKNPGSKSKRSTVDKALIESSTRPLARVAWFRVILDEAQTIKNHRTQVAGACCGLRAKRRWCLSGTPIQNAIDDLYSYFRFLRYDPYASYKSFCANIKIPINKHPNTGYKKLQAVLKTIMLRRTKGTLLDGQPVIALPPKTVTLKKVDFSSGERSFYCRLEAESREQFKVYADAGTVKQNYVNILLMLLRLRQACDHPVLVQGYDSNSIWNSSVESAKRLPGDKRLELLNCLEASQAICTICNDPPEDAVVAICGHVFCNQCVCEHFTVDDKHCPSPQCKVKLDANSVFPRASLESSIADLHGDDIHSGSCIDQDMSEPYKDLLSSDSSKIKAAIEILQSLPRLRDNPVNNSPNHDDAEQLTETTHEKDPVMDDTGQPNLKKCFNSHRSEKAIVFSQWTRMLDLLEARLKSSYIQYRRLDGTMSVAARDKAVKDFNTLPEVTVMIMSLKAASLGLNMVAACHVVLLDLWWNPTTEDQAIDRAHRIGQTRPVTVSRLTVKDTVEDRILALQEKKREMVASAFGEDENGSRQSRLTVEDLNYLFMA